MTGKHGAVMLIVTGLSDRASYDELRSPFKQLIKSRAWTPWSGQGTIRSCNIIRVTDRDTGDTEYQGLVELQPAKLALLAIRELNGTMIGGHPVEIRRYHHRPLASHHGDYAPEGGTLESNSPDSRGSNLTIELVERRNMLRFPLLRNWFAPAARETYKLKAPERHAT